MQGRQRQELISKGKEGVVSYCFRHFPHHILRDGEAQFLIDQLVELIQTHVHQLHKYPDITLREGGREGGGTAWQSVQWTDRQTNRQRLTG